MRVLRCRALALCCCLAPLYALTAGEPPPKVEPKAEPPKIIGPYPELREVLYFESFEGPTTSWSRGKVAADTVQAPGTHSYKLGENDWGKADKWVQANLGLPLSVKIPGGLEPSQIHIQFMIWADELVDKTEFIIRFKDGDFDERPRIARLKTWVPVTLRLADTIHDRKPPGKDLSFHLMEILFKPKDKAKYPNVFIDDFAITYGAKPAEIMPRLLAADAKRTAMTRSADRDGFNYNLRNQDELAAALKASKVKHKAKSIVVMGAQAGDNAALVKGLNAGAAKLKAAGFLFTPAATPDAAPSAGLDDMRTLLQYNLHKADAEVALLMLNYADSLRPGRPAESLRIVLERTLESGCVPVVVLPPAMPALAKEEKDKLDGFINTVTNVCIQKGIPWIDSSLAVKSLQAPFDNATKELNASGVEGVGALAAQVVKHLDQWLFGRKG